MRRVLVAVSALLLVSMMSGSRTIAAPPTQSSPQTSAALPVSSPPKFEPPEVVATADAAYPINSVAFGTVVLVAHLDASGEIENVTVARDIPPLTKQALEAIKLWRFKAAMLDGKPVPSVVPVAFIFVRPDLFPRYGGQPRP